MNINAILHMQQDYERDLRIRLDASETNIRNLERMAHEYVTSLNKRCEEDKKAVAELFFSLITNEEVTRNAIRTELCIDHIDTGGQNPEGMNQINAAPSETIMDTLGKSKTRKA